MSTAITQSISVEDARQRGYNLAEPIIISGPKESFTEENINKVIKAAAKYLVARDNLEEKKDALDKQNTDRSIAQAATAFALFKVVQNQIADAYLNTKLIVDFSKKI